MDTTDHMAARMASMPDSRDDDFSESGEHGSAPDDEETQHERKMSQSKPASSQITLQDLERYYDVPLTEVAKKLNISITMLKKLCRKFGINRWPHRQIRSINNTVQALQEQYATSQTEDERARIEEQITSMKRKRRLVCRSASCGLNAALRNAIFLARPGELDEEVLFEQGLLPNLQAAMTHKIKADTSQRLTTTSDTAAFPLHDLETAGMAHVNKYRATNRRERAGTAATVPYGSGMMMPNAPGQMSQMSQMPQIPQMPQMPGQMTQVSQMQPHFGESGDHYEYRNMHQHFGGIPGSTSGQYPVGSAALQQHLMQQFSHYNRTTAPLDSFSGSHVATRPHPLTGLPSSVMSDQSAMKSGVQMPQSMPPYGGQPNPLTNHQLQNEQALMQWQMMHNAPSANYPSLSIHPQGATQSSVGQFGQALGGGMQPNEQSSNVSGNGGGGGGEGQPQYHNLNESISPVENAKRLYGYNAYDPRPQQPVPSANSSNNPNTQNTEQYSDMSGQEYLRSNFRTSDSFENLAYAQGLAGANFLSSQFSEYRSRSDGSNPASHSQPSRGDIVREASDYPTYNITI